jgi:hypothetical protein
MSKIVNDDLMGLIEKTSDLTPEVGRIMYPHLFLTVDLHRHLFDSNVPINENLHVMKALAK